ncbi:MAG: hypothetical protein BWX46_00447 [Candidatus Cloacimonetes bacterium ADurb.Bin003]|nr:MAG: hypothetical protein BWX46_00447 [Candidatus Cloacimonetes bacterium ADurb.Bin003]
MKVITFPELPTVSATVYSANKLKSPSEISLRFKESSQTLFNLYSCNIKGLRGRAERLLMFIVRKQLSVSVIGEGSSVNLKRHIATAFW